MTTTKKAREPQASGTPKTPGFTERLNELLVRKGLTNRSEAARRIGITNGSMSKLARGASQPSSETLARMAVGFKLTPDELFWLLGLEVYESRCVFARGLTKGRLPVAA